MLNNFCGAFPVRMKVTMAPLLNLWCGDLLVQQLSQMLWEQGFKDFHGYLCMFEGLSHVLLLFSAVLIRQEGIFELDFSPRDMRRQKLSHIWTISLCRDEGHIYRSVRHLKFSQLRNPQSALIKLTVVFFFFLPLSSLRT